MSSCFPKIEITLDAGGRGKLVVDGTDFSHCVSAINVKSRPGKLTTVYVALVGDVEIKCDGEVLPEGFVRRATPGWSAR